MNFLDKYSIEQNNFAEIFNKTKVLHVLLQDKMDTEIYYRQLAKLCGIPLIYEEDPLTGAINVSKWTEIKYDPLDAENTYKSSNKSQPLHTDYGYFSFEIYTAFFYCVTQAEFGGATTFIDVDTLVKILNSSNPKLLKHLLEQKIQFGRADNPIAQNADYILQRDELGWKINWNYYRALGDQANKGLIEEFKGFIDNSIEKSGELAELKLQPGEGVFFQDRRVLHGRNSFVGNRQLNKGGIASSIPTEVLKMLKIA